MDDSLPPCSDPTNAIIDAVDRKTFDSDLIDDGSREYAGIGRSCTIIDCRYPHKFQGGHIEVMSTSTQKKRCNSSCIKLSTRLNDTHWRKRIFHREFSSERAPNMYRFLREQDRILNKDQYIHLCYPDIYLLEGGCKAFYENHKHYCEPIEYKPMLHKYHAAEVRHFKAKPKSWTAVDKRQRHLSIDWSSEIMDRSSIRIWRRSTDSMYC